MAGDRMTDDVPESQTGRWPWRYRCPENHTSIRMNAQTFWCSTCRESYDKDRLQDLKPVES